MSKNPRDIALNWQRHGLEHHNNGLPTHPEFIFRLSGEWQGWSDFLGTRKGTHEYKANATVDAVESEAYLILQNQRC